MNTTEDNTYRTRKWVQREKKVAIIAQNMWIILLLLKTTAYIS